MPRRCVKNFRINMVSGLSRLTFLNDINGNFIFLRFRRAEGLIVKLQDFGVHSAHDLSVLVPELIRVFNLKGLPSATTIFLTTALDSYFILIILISAGFIAGVVALGRCKQQSSAIHSYMFALVAFSLIVDTLLTGAAYFRLNFEFFGSRDLTPFSTVRGRTTRFNPFRLHRKAGGFGFVFEPDLVSIYFYLLVLLVFLLVLFFFRETTSSSRLAGLFLILKVSCFLVFMGHDWLGFVLGSEISLWALWLFLSASSSRARQSAAAFYVFYSTAGGLLSLLGALLIKSSGASILFVDLISHTRLAGFRGDYRFLLGLMFLLLGVLIKIPVAPFQHWLLVAHVEASTAGSVILAAVLLKLPAYALVRIFFSMTFFTATNIKLFVLFFCLLSVFVCALRLVQETDLKRFVALCSIIHMSTCISLFSLLNSKNAIELLSVVVVLLYSHSLSSAAMFSFVGMISSRFHTRNIREIHGLFKSVPQLSLHFFIVSLLSTALPVGVTFSAEQMLFWEINSGCYRFLALLYLLALFFVFLKTCALFLQMASGEKPDSRIIVDLTRAEFILSLLLIFGLFVTFVFGLYSIWLLGLSLNGLIAAAKLPRFAKRLLPRATRPLTFIPLKRGKRMSRKTVLSDYKSVDLQSFESDSAEQQLLDFNLRLRLALRMAALSGLPGYGPSSVAGFKNNPLFESKRVSPLLVKPSDVEIPLDLIRCEVRDTAFVYPESHLSFNAFAEENANPGLVESTSSTFPSEDLIEEYMVFLNRHYGADVARCIRPAVNEAIINNPRSTMQRELYHLMVCEQKFCLEQKAVLERVTREEKMDEYLRLKLNDRVHQLSEVGSIDADNLLDIHWQSLMLKARRKWRAERLSEIEQQSRAAVDSIRRGSVLSFSQWLDVKERIAAKAAAQADSDMVEHEISCDCPQCQAIAVHPVSLFDSVGVKHRKLVHIFGNDFGRCVRESAAERHGETGESSSKPELYDLFQCGTEFHSQRLAETEKSKADTKNKKVDKTD